LIFDIELIGERTMVFSHNPAVSRPFAILLSAAFVAACWLPTISVPAQAADGAAASSYGLSDQGARIVIAAPAAPALM
jgi:hypothetical protein